MKILIVNRALMNMLLIVLNVAIRSGQKIAIEMTTVPRIAIVVIET
jgi:hypothetical protein